MQLNQSIKDSANRAGRSTEPSLVGLAEPWSRTDWILVAGLFMAGILMFLPGLGAPGILGTSDGYYTEGAREMLELGNYLVPYLYYEPLYAKPILIYWLIISSYKIFGLSTFASRLPSALAAISMVVVTFSSGRFLVNRRSATLAALALLTMPIFIGVGHLALTDMPLTLFSTAAVFSFMLVIKGFPRQLLMAGYICLGLAFLCKGPIGLVFSLVAVSGYLLATTKTRRELCSLARNLISPLGIALAFVVAAPWFIWIHSATGGAFTHTFFFEHNIARATGSLGSHNEPVWFYIPVLVGGLMPWSLLAVQNVILFRKRARTSEFLPGHKDLAILCLCWTVGTVALLSCSVSKLATYILPVAPAVALLAGIELDMILDSNRRRLFAWLSPILVIGGIVSLCLFPGLLHGSSVVRALIIVTILLLLTAMVAVNFLVWKRHLFPAVVTLSVSLLIGCAILAPVTMSYIYRERTGMHMHRLISKVRDIKSSVAVVGFPTPSATYYLRRKAEFVTDYPSTQEFLEKTPGPHLFLVDEVRFSSLVQWLKNSAQVIDIHGDWRIVRPR